MNILFISDNKISGYGGGSIENKKYYNIIERYAKQYGDNFRVISPDNNLKESVVVKVRKNKFTDILIRLKGHSSFLYDVWKENSTIINNYKPDIVVLGRSRFGFIAKDLKNKFPNCKIISNVDNVEQDFVKYCFIKKRSIISDLKYFVEKKCVIRDEKDTVKYSDFLVFLTKRNHQRFKELYAYEADNYEIIPICLENEVKLKERDEIKNIVFVGSLDYSPNISTVKTILYEIYKPFFEKDELVRLIIAGRNPSYELEKEILSFENVELYKNFCDIADIIPEGSLMLCPIKKGAGMKVKVAEALAMGAIIAGSDEALVGYENAEKHLLNQGIYLCNTTADFVNAINNYLNMNSEKVKLISSENKKTFIKYHSYEFAYEIFSRVMKTISSDM